MNKNLKTVEGVYTHTDSFKERRNRGITLIALTITIILLLILAGVAISALSNNGIFERAKEAREKWQNAQELENTTLADYEKQVELFTRDGQSLYGYDSTTGFYYQKFSNGVCILWQNYIKQDTTSTVDFSFPFEFEVPPSIQVTKIDNNSNYNNIVARNITVTSFNLDTNVGYSNKCDVSITIFGKLK